MRFLKVAFVLKNVTAKTLLCLQLIYVHLPSPLPQELVEIPSATKACLAKGNGCPVVPKTFPDFSTKTSIIGKTIRSPANFDGWCAMLNQGLPKKMSTSQSLEPENMLHYCGKRDSADVAN